MSMKTRIKQLERRLSAALAPLEHTIAYDITPGATAAERQALQARILADRGSVDEDHITWVCFRSNIDVSRL